MQLTSLRAPLPLAALVVSERKQGEICCRCRGQLCPLSIAPPMRSSQQYLCSAGAVAVVSARKFAAAAAAAADCYRQLTCRYLRVDQKRCLAAGAALWNANVSELAGADEAIAEQKPAHSDSSCKSCHQELNVQAGPNHVHINQEALQPTLPKLN